jgi:hypothetical protein
VGVGLTVGDGSLLNPFERPFTLSFLSKAGKGLSLVFDVVPLVIKLAVGLASIVGLSNSKGVGCRGRMVVGLQGVTFANFV